MADFAAKQCRCKARPAHGAANARRLPPQAARVKSDCQLAARDAADAGKVVTVQDPSNTAEQSRRLLSYRLLTAAIASERSTSPRIRQKISSGQKILFCVPRTDGIEWAVPVQIGGDVRALAFLG